MNYIILTLVYFIGASIMFYQSLALDSLSISRHGTRGGFCKFSSYLLLCAVWPITMWVQMFFRYLEVRDEAKISEKDDRSAWMFCARCNVKWRPTAYGPPTPDDFFCPECNKDGGVKLIQDIRQVIREGSI